MTSDEMKDWLAKNEVEQVMSSIFRKRYYHVTNEQLDALGQFIAHTGMDVAELKKCLTKGYLQMVQESINKAIQEFMDT